jgi:hypothetical protein
VAADVLSELGSRRALVLAGVFVQDLRKPSIKLLDPDSPELPQHDQASAPPCDVLMSEKDDAWRKPFIEFILDQLVLEDKVECERIVAFLSIAPVLCSPATMLEMLVDVS